MSAEKQIPQRPQRMSLVFWGRQVCSVWYTVVRSGPPQCGGSGCWTCRRGKLGGPAAV